VNVLLEHIWSTIAAAFIEMFANLFPPDHSGMGLTWQFWARVNRCINRL